MKVNLNNEPDGVGKIFKTITIVLAIGLNSIVLILWFIYTKNNPDIAFL